MLPQNKALSASNYSQPLNNFNRLTFGHPFGVPFEPEATLTSLQIGVEWSQVIMDVNTWVVKSIKYYP